MSKTFCSTPKKYFLGGKSDKLAKKVSQSTARQVITAAIAAFLLGCETALEGTATAPTVPITSHQLHQRRKSYKGGKFFQPGTPFVGGYPAVVRHAALRMKRKSKQQRRYLELPDEILDGLVHFEATPSVYKPVGKAEFQRRKSARAQAREIARQNRQCKRNERLALLRESAFLWGGYDIGIVYRENVEKLFDGCGWEPYLG